MRFTLSQHQGGPLLAVLLLILGVAGCSSQKTYPVQGQIIHESGGPAVELEGGTVQFTSEEVEISAEGSIGPGGTFTLATYKPGDGAIAGKHRVTISPPTSSNIDAPTRPLISPQLMSVEDTPLLETVEPRENKITIRLPRFQR